MKNMLFIMNPKAGRTTLKNSLVDVLEVFCNNDYAVRTYLTKSADDAERIVQEEGANYDVIVCAGGDGTLGNTVTGYMKSGIRVPLGYIRVAPPMTLQGAWTYRERRLRRLR